MVSTQLKNISQNGNLPQVGLNIKNLWNHHLAHVWHLIPSNFTKFPDLISKKMCPFPSNCSYPSEKNRPTKTQPCGPVQTCLVDLFSFPGIFQTNLRICWAWDGWIGSSPPFFFLFSNGCVWWRKEAFQCLLFIAGKKHVEHNVRKYMNMRHYTKMNIHETRFL